jgi:hypothetical protein
VRRAPVKWSAIAKRLRKTVLEGHAVNHWPLTAEAQVRARINPCVICGSQSGIGTGFSPSSLVFPCYYHSTIAPYSSITAP